MRIELDVHTPADLPTVAGWFLVWVRLSDKPLVLWWSKLSTQWRQDMQAVQCVAWAGPLPERYKSRAAHGQA